MAYGNAFGRDASRIGPLSPARLEHELSPRCTWRDGDGRCGRRCVEGIPLCYGHGLRVSGVMMAVIREERDAPPDDADRWPTEEEIAAADAAEAAARAALPPPAAFVYYLMLSPTTVKIGTSRDLPTRIKTQGGQLQYVVALERGSYDVESARHEQFKMERHGVREVFTLSDALREHIETLTPQLDALMALATARPVVHLLA